MNISDFVSEKISDSLARASQPAPVVITKPIVKLAPENDTGALGDNITTLSAVTLVVQNPTEFVWAEPVGITNAGTAGFFDPGIDSLGLQGKLSVSLKPGNNTFAVYQQQADLVSEPTYISVYLDPLQSARQTAVLDQLAIAYWGRPLTPEELQLGSTLLAQIGGDALPLARYLSQTPEFTMWLQGLDWQSALDRIYQSLFARSATPAEKTSWFNQYQQGLDPALIPYLLIQNAVGPDAAVLATKTLFSSEATEAYATLKETQPGSMKSDRILIEAERLLLHKVRDLPTLAASLNSLEAVVSAPANVIKPVDGKLVKKVLSLEFDRPIDWQRLDQDGNGSFTINEPGGIGELFISIGGKGGFSLTNQVSKFSAAVPAIGSMFLTVNNVEWTDSNGNDDATVSVLIIGLPDLQDGIVSNVLFLDLPTYPG